MSLEFEWDTSKALANKQKHGVSFEEAKSCFFDPLHVVIKSEDRSSEQRMILMGVSSKNRTLVVIHLETEEQIIRIISARKTTKKELRQYEEIQ